MGQYNDQGDVQQMYEEGVRAYTSTLNLALAASDELFFTERWLREGMPAEQSSAESEAGRLDLLRRKKVEVARFAYLHLGEIGSGARVLDAGCGTGGGAILMHKQYGCEVQGVTLSGEEERYARDAAWGYGIGMRVRFAVADMGAYAEAHGPWDAVCAFESTEHVDDLRGLFASFGRGLKPGGRVVVSACCVSRGPEFRAEKERFDRQNRTNISTEGQYWGAAAGAGLPVRECFDLTGACEWYWELRSRCDAATPADEFMRGAFAARIFTYKLFVLEA